MDMKMPYCLVLRQANAVMKCIEFQFGAQSLRRVLHWNVYVCAILAIDVRLTIAACNCRWTSAVFWRWATKCADRMSHSLIAFAAVWCTTLTQDFQYTTALYDDGHSALEKDTRCRLDFASRLHASSSRSESSLNVDGKKAVTRFISYWARKVSLPADLLGWY